MIEIAKIRTDGGTQSRAEISQETVSEYAEAMRDPETVFPPAIVYYDGREYWLADGFHRVEAWREVGRVEIPAEVRQGDRRQAILHSCAANSAHGLRRTNADKKRAIWTLLEDPEWSQWSDREIARRVRVHHGTVAKYREEISGGYLDKSPDSHERKVERGGTTYTQNTINIGQSKPDQEKPQTYADAGADAEAFEEGASGGVREGDTPAPESEPTPDPYGYAKLTEEALLETANGLREQLGEERKKRKRAEAERDRLKAENKGYEGDQAETIRRLSKALKHKDSEIQRANDKFAAEKRKTYSLKKQIEELTGEEVAL